jgi:hypothetical protein
MIFAEKKPLISQGLTGCDKINLSRKPPAERVVYEEPYLKNRRTGIPATPVYTGINQYNR